MKKNIPVKTEKKELETPQNEKPAVSTPNPKKDTSAPKKLVSDDTAHTYQYVLTTAKQKEDIDLTKSKVKLKALFTKYFGKRLISVEVDSSSYTICLTDEFKVGEKRQLGRSVGNVDDLKAHAKKIYYNNGADFSTQLFKLSKAKT